MAEKGIRGGICHAIHRYAKANNKYLKNYDKKQYHHTLDATNMYRWTMSQKLPVNGFKQVKKLSKFDKHFIKDYDENSEKGYFLEVDVENTKNLFNGIGFNRVVLNIHMDLPFLPERNKTKKI